MSAHDRGTVLTQLAMTIAAGGRCVTDLKTLRDQPRLFGEVASDPTAWRVVHEVDDERRGAVATANLPGGHIQKHEDPLEALHRSYVKSSASRS